MASSHSRASCRGRSSTQTKATSASRAVTHYILMMTRLIFLVLIVAACSISYLQDYPTELTNLLLATALLGFEVFQKIKTDHILKSVKTFKLKSRQWLNGVAQTAILVFFFSDEPMNFLNISAIATIALAGILNIYQNSTIKYTIETKGIRNLFSGKLLDSKTITNVNYSEIEIGIDTRKYQNDLVIKSSNLVAPTWNELAAELKKLEVHSG